MAGEKKIELTPDWRSWFWWYLWGILLIPLFGIGIYIIWRANKSRKAFHYEIYDRYIISRDSKYTQRMELANITGVNVRQRWIDKKFSSGDILLSTAAATMEIRGVRDPHQMAGAIEHAVAAEKKRLEQSKARKPSEEHHPPGTLDKMNYLTGLWQQGLISNEDFEKERKHFE
ncbi:MAG: PH domain-containing protein [Balneolaceae bacterium]